MQTAPPTSDRPLLAVLAALLLALLPAPARAAGDAEGHVAWRIPVSGPVDGALKERTLRHARRAVSQGANLLILDLECSDGDDQAAYELADELIRLTDEGPATVRTVAYVRPPARNTATFIALACDRIFMDPKARLGDWEAYVRKNPGRQAVLREHLVDVARRKHRPEALARAMLDNRLHLYLVYDAGSFRLETERPANEPSEQIKPAPHGDPLAYLTLDAELAEKLDVARRVDSPERLYRRLGLEESEVAVARNDLLDDLGALLRSDWLRALLVTVGLIGLLLELRRPGLHVAGVLSAVCFVLFFWAHSQLAGRMTVLALLLFLLGVGLLVLAVLLRPGHRVAAAGGVLLLALGLGLAAYGQWPRGGAGWSGYGQALGQVGVAVLAGLALCFLAVRYLPQLPVANKLVLKPRAAAGDAEGPPPAPERPELADLLGAIGVAATPLRPAGKVQFGEQFLDVVSDGPYVVPGARVQVVEIEGRRVVVKPV
jgi:membrane-bound serine protease (ClpP class)